MRKIYIALSLFLAFGLSKAQTPLQVIIANGGVFGPTNKATIATWDPGTSN